MMTPPCVSVNSRLLTRRRYRPVPRNAASRRRRSRHGHGPVIAALVALGLAAGLERLIYRQIDDQLAAMMLALIVLLIGIIAIARGTRSRRR